MSFRTVAAVALSTATLIVLAGSPCHAASNLVVNGGFETGDFTGWANSSNDTFIGVDDKFAHSGTFSAFFGNETAVNHLTQIAPLATTPGDNYAFSFWFLCDGATPVDNVFQAFFGNAQVLSLTNAPQQDFTLFSFVVTATSTATPIQFNFRDGPGFLNLDDVSVTDLGPAPTAAPLPTTATTGLTLIGLSAVPLLRRRMACKS